MTLGLPDPSEYFPNAARLRNPDEAPSNTPIRATVEDLVSSRTCPTTTPPYPPRNRTFLSLDGVPESSQREILWDNCARLYNIS